MLLRTLRQLAVFFAVGGFLLAATTQLIPIVAAAPDCDMTLMIQGQDGKAHVPCTDMTPSCIIDASCALVVSLPAPNLAFSASMSWARVAYVTASESFRGLSIKPDLSPPILPA